MAPGDVRFSVRPVFISWITLLMQLPVQLFLTFWAGGFFGAMTKSTGLVGRDSSAPFIFFGVLALVATPVVAYFGKKLNYGRTDDRLLEDHR
jgi:hypothetical protein